MPISTSDLAELKARALDLGFSGLRITDAALPARVGRKLSEFVDADYVGDMVWLKDSTRRSTPTAMWAEARSAIVVAMNYAPSIEPMERLDYPETGVISVYALNRDYHDVIKGKLKTLANHIARQFACDVKVFVDTAPLMEKPLAAQAGLGWQGKHTNLVSRELGSWFFLGVILTSAILPAEPPETDHCGSCQACLDVCPTNAFPQPYVLDARRCISYLTIEHKGHIATEFRLAMGNRVYGCDDCLAVCPWNKFAQEAREAKLAARADLIAPKLAELLGLDDASFKKMFSGSPVKRIGRDRFIRNCLIAAGNSENKNMVPAILPLLQDASPLVRAMAVWALKQLSPSSVGTMPAEEQDRAVIAEWRTA